MNNIFYNYSNGSYMNMPKVSNIFVLYVCNVLKNDEVRVYTDDNNKVRLPLKRLKEIMVNVKDKFEFIRWEWNYINRVFKSYKIWEDLCGDNFLLSKIDNPLTLDVLCDFTVELKCNQRHTDITLMRYYIDNKLYDKLYLILRERHYDSKEKTITLQRYQADDLVYGYVELLNSRLKESEDNLLDVINVTFKADVAASISLTPWECSSVSQLHFNNGDYLCTDCMHLNKIMDIIINTIGNTFVLHNEAYKIIDPFIEGVKFKTDYCVESKALNKYGLSRIIERATFTDDYFEVTEYLLKDLNLFRMLAYFKEEANYKKVNYYQVYNKDSSLLLKDVDAKLWDSKIVKEYMKHVKGEQSDLEKIMYEERCSNDEELLKRFITLQCAKVFRVKEE